MTPVRLGFTGTSRGLTDPQFMRLLGWVTQRRRLIIEAHHGDCVEGDERFDLCCVVSGIPRVIHPPMVDAKRAFCARLRPVLVIEREPGPYLWRNHQIVDATGALIAAPFEFEEQLRSGTWATVRYARTLRRPIRFFWPDGSSSVDGTQKVAGRSTLHP